MIRARAKERECETIQFNAGCDNDIVIIIMIIDDTISDALIVTQKSGQIEFVVFLFRSDSLRRAFAAVVEVSNNIERQIRLSWSNNINMNDEW